MLRISQLAIGIALALSLSTWLAWATNGTRTIWLAVPLALLSWLCWNRPSACLVLRIVALMHAIAAVAMIRVYSREVMDVQDYLFYVFRNVTIPGLALAFLVPKAVGSSTEELPPGYEYFNDSKRKLSGGERLALVIIMSFSVAALMAGWIALSIFLLPAGFAAYYIFNMMFFKRRATPSSPRRIKLSPKIQKPAQTRSHWTVNDTEFHDPDLYDQ